MYLAENISQYNNASEFFKDCELRIPRISKKVREGDTNNSIGMDIRHVDNKWGNASHSTNGKLSGCAGARFRTANFLSLELDKRSGDKKDKHTEYGIHIEHSIPVLAKTDILRALQPDTDETLRILKLVGIAVAMTRREEETVTLPGYKSKHPDITGDLSKLDLLSIRPFARYKEGTIIYDMLTGDIVPLDAKISDLVLK